MKNSRWILGLFVALGAAPCVPAFGGDIYVVASKGMALSLEDVREVYLGDKEFIGGTRVVPVDNQEAQGDFVTKALTMDRQRYSQLWIKKAFRDGLSPPAMIATDTAVLEYVKRTRGAIGYVVNPPREKEIVVVGKF
jgi:hypothetical protein